MSVTSSPRHKVKGKALALLKVMKKAQNGESHQSLNELI